jgi:hypothetical protein
MIRYLADQILALIQKRCDHPGELIKVDMLEGSSMDTEVTYCGRCGAYQIGWKRPDGSLTKKEWRHPNPNLWRFM